MSPLLLLGLALAAAPAVPERGREVYLAWCAQCHGDTGEADGPAAPFMFPRPRIFADNSSFKLRSTPSGELPTDDDLLAVVTDGIPGSAMPGFAVLPLEDRRSVVAFVKSLSPDFSDPDFTDVAIPMPELAVAEVPPGDAAAVARGRALYDEMECFKCHGAAGRGDGPSRTKLSDDFGERMVAADLTDPGRFRGGSGVADVFRTLSTGLNGTPMPSYADTLDPAQRWDLAWYVGSLAAPPADSADLVRAPRVEVVPLEPGDEAWQRAPTARFPLLPNLVGEVRRYWPSVRSIDVQALHDGTALALRLAWNDRDRSVGDPGSVYDDRDGEVRLDAPHPDQVAVQLPLRHDSRERPHFLFGDARRPVVLWWWTAGEGARAVIGRGPERLVPLSDRAPEVRVQYQDGRYAVVLRRPLDGEPEITAGRYIPLAVSVWDGSRGEVGSRRSLTTWRWLRLEAEPSVQARAAPAAAFFLCLGLLLGLGRAVREAQR